MKLRNKFELALLKILLLLSRCQNSCPRRLNIIKNIWFHDFLFLILSSLLQRYLQWFTIQNKRKVQTSSIQLAVHSTVQYNSIPYQCPHFFSSCWELHQTPGENDKWFACPTHFPTVPYTLPYTALHTSMHTSLHCPRYFITVTYTYLHCHTLAYTSLHFPTLFDNSKHFPSLPYNSIHFPRVL